MVLCCATQDAWAAPPRYGYITNGGTVYVDGSNTGAATLRPRWSPDEVHVFQLVYADSAGQVHWYRANAVNLYIGLDHRAKAQNTALVWVYYRDFLGQAKFYSLDATFGDLAGAAARK
jgi:hypothetical protein